MIKRNLDYKDGNTALEGYIAYKGQKGAPDSAAEINKKPAVLVFHAWAGKDEFSCRKAESLAELGYVGVAVDVFGKGILGKSKEENQKLIAPFVEDRKMLRNRILAGLEAVRNLSFVDSRRIGAIGFCFGGLCALDLARSGADVRGVVSFHGLLGATGLQSVPIRSKVLALHGHDDPMVPPEQVLAFEKEMTTSNADWQIHTYGNTMHAFTVQEANDPSFGTVYNKKADLRSWQAMKTFFEEVMVG